MGSGHATIVECLLEAGAVPGAVTETMRTSSSAASLSPKAKKSKKAKSGKGKRGKIGGPTGRPPTPKTQRKSRTKQPPSSKPPDADESLRDKAVEL
jgi:hypothetical protein